MFGTARIWASTMKDPGAKPTTMELPSKFADILLMVLATAEDLRRSTTGIIPFAS
jgi:hypothetical protein